MKKVHWTTLILLSGIAMAIISMFLVFPSLDQKAIEEYKTHYKYINSEEERDFSGNTFIKEPTDDSIPMEYSRIEEYMEPALQRITLLVGTLLFAWSLLMPYKWAVKSGFYRFFTQRLPYEITLGAALLGLYFYVPDVSSAGGFLTGYSLSRYMADFQLLSVADCLFKRTVRSAFRMRLCDSLHAAQRCAGIPAKALPANTKFRIAWQTGKTAVSLYYRL